MNDKPISVFLSFPRATQTGGDSCSPVEEAYIHRVSYYLRKQPDLDVFCYDIDGPDQLWKVHVTPHLSQAEVFVLFLGTELREGSGQELEFKTWRDHCPKMARCFAVELRRNQANQCLKLDILEKYSVLGKEPLLIHNDLDKAHACAQEIYSFVHHGRNKLIWVDDLPIGYPLGYEKQIIDAFAAEGNNPFSPRIPPDPRLLLRQPGLLAAGSLVKWPTLKSTRRCPFKTPLSKEDVGGYRDGNVIIVDPRGAYHKRCSGGTCLNELNLEIPEAGPRSKVAFPIINTRKLTIGVVVSGGIAPGINAVLEGIVERHRQYNTGSGKGLTATPPAYMLTIRVFAHGLVGIADGQKAAEIVIDTNGSTKHGSGFLDKLHRAKSEGGSVVSTARHDDLLDGKLERHKSIDALVKKLTKPTSDCRVDILYVIGGEGSMRAAHAIAYRAKLSNMPLSVVGIPKTMDNDILWVWQSFGFLSAVEKAREFFTQLETEVRSNPRFCVMQLFGSDSGFVVSHAALAGGNSCLAALIPEIHFSVEGLTRYIRERTRLPKLTRPIPKKTNLQNQPENTKDHGILVLAETAVPVDVEDYVEEPYLQLSGEEKSAVRKFVGSPMLTEDEIPEDEWQDFIGKLVKAGNPLAARADLGDTFNLEELESLKGILSRLKSHKGNVQLIKEQEKTRVVSIVNSVMLRKADDWAGISTGEGSLALFGKSVQNGIRYTQCYVETKGIKFPVDHMRHLKALASVMSLPYEAAAIIKEFDRIKEIDPKAQPSLALAKQLLKRLKETQSRLVAETYLGIPARRWTAHRDRRVFGQTPDALRTASLKIVSGVLKKHVSRIFASEPRHLIRAIGPSCHDVIFGDRMGRLAVDGAMSGFQDFMISQWLTEFVLVPLPLVVQGRKRVPSDGIFWKSVIASTRQPANLWY